MNKINCENDLCIYWKNGDICQFDTIRLNSMGICVDGINVDFGKKATEEKRQEMLNKIK